MTLLFIAAATFFLIGRGKSTMATAGSQDLNVSSPVSIDWKLLAMTVLAVEIITGVILLIVRADAVDTIGSLAAGLIVAFILQMFIANSRRQ